MKIGPHLLNQVLELGASTSKCRRNRCCHLFSPKNSVAELSRSDACPDFSSVPQIGISFIQRLGNRKGYAQTILRLIAETLNDPDFTSSRPRCACRTFVPYRVREADAGGTRN